MLNGRQCRPAGFAYLLLLVALAVVGAASAASLSVGATLGRRAAEEDLLAIGAEYERALASYSRSTPAGKSPYPKTLDELMSDPRYPGVKRHLRKVYVDPLTGSDAWGFMRSPDGAIVGIFSRAHGVPIKRSGFAPGWERFSEAKDYSDWVFGQYQHFGRQPNTLRETSLEVFPDAIVQIAVCTFPNVGARRVCYGS